MKNETLYIERLITYANHLARITQVPELIFLRKTTLVVLRHSTRVSYDVIYPQWIFNELPYIFQDWSFTEEDSEPVLIEKETSETEGTIASVFNFFGLTEAEFRKLFDVRCYEEKLTKNKSESIIIANNIKELVKQRRNRVQSDLLPSHVLKLQMLNGKVLAEIPLN